MLQLFSLELDGEINNQGIRSVAAVLLSFLPCGQLHHHSPKHLRCVRALTADPEECQMKAAVL